MKCDMCNGSGVMQTYQTAGGAQVYGSTSIENADAVYRHIDDGLKDGTIVLADIPCHTCRGTGIMPEYLARYYR